MKIHEKYISRCILLGSKALGMAAPNPMVGSLIVHGERIIGEGYTSPYGGPHAEINALASVRDRSILPEATLYVTLEPCCHYGKTPPCTDAIIKSGIRKVVVGSIDPHGKVAGKGIAQLKGAGCEVTVGVMEQACKQHHKRFFTSIISKRPYIILKWAQSADGFLAPEMDKRKGDGRPYWLTNSLSRQRVHQWRSEEQAILVGTETAIQDNPVLNVRHWKGTAPVRVVLDRNLRLDPSLEILQGPLQTLVLTEESGPQKANPTHANILFDNKLAENICKELFERSITSVIIEGGRKTLETFIDANLWDEARVFTGTSFLKAGLRAPLLRGITQYREPLGGDELSYYTNDTKHNI